MTKPTSKNEAARKIFNGTGGTKTFAFSIPYIHFHTAKEFEQLGVLSTGDKRIDDSLMNELFEIGGSIEDMARYFHRNVPITLKTTSDSILIYDLIIEHIDNWIEHVSSDINVSKAPLDGLEILDEFARTLYPYARTYRARLATRDPLRERVNTFLKGFVGGPGRSTTATVTTTPEPWRNAKPVPVDSPKPSNGSSDYFARLTKTLENRNRGG